jgi:hypothetical protein|eukprot:COSAG01_NODE_4998_length_4557_cov_61.708903_3_plen_50_part_00
MTMQQTLSCPTDMMPSVEEVSALPDSATMQTSRTNAVNASILAPHTPLL